MGLIVSLEQAPREDVGEDKVRVKMLMASINPADINQIEGTYAFIPPCPFVGGNEGVGEIVELGGAISRSHLQVGDWVIPSVAGLGTWREEIVCGPEAVRKVPRSIPLEVAATILINPCTAYRMLHDFVDLKPGDCVIQNGANSAVGRAVIQFCKAMGVQTINVVRDRPGFEALEKELRSLGATLIVKAERLPLPETITHITTILDNKKPVLALNCVGGQSATDLARTLEAGGIMVTYGGMSKKPVTIPTGLLIFNQIRVEGFWISAWYKREAEILAKGDDSLTMQREEMINVILDMYKKCQLTMPPCRTHPLSSWQSALEKAISPYTGYKELFKF